MLLIDSGLVFIDVYLDVDLTVVWRDGTVYFCYVTLGKKMVRG